ncbi:MAG: PKD domain-containing protein [Chloroflexi bacterium]|nr:PKD domain-containing protein [Chloroflexota bacterium]
MSATRLSFTLLSGIYDVALTANMPWPPPRQPGGSPLIPHPTAQFKVDDASPGVGQIVTFINESGGEAPITYQWDFGDGSTSTETNPTHQYAAPGTYPASLTIENAYGLLGTVLRITVGQPPTAEMLLGDLARTGQPVGGSRGCWRRLVTAQWDMGDGRTIEGAQSAICITCPAITMSR